MVDRNKPQKNEPPPLEVKPPFRIAEKWQRLFGGIAVVAMVILLVAVVKSTGAPPPSLPQPLDPSVTNEAELRRVTEAISRIVTSADDRRRLSALEVLEAVSVQSPGAADLREACVSTYRGLQEAQSNTEQLRAILQDSDGGERNPTEINAEMRSRAGQLFREANNQRERATQSRARCEDLYRTAVQRFGMNPQRPRSL